MSEQTKSTKTTATTPATETAQPIQPAMTTETVIDAILSSLPNQDYTGYRIHTIINAAFAILEIDRKIEPQRMYQAAKAGQIDGVKHVKGDDPRYTVAQVREFAIRYIEGSLKSGGTSSRIEIKSLIAAASAKLTK
jgi:hypothetical protein